MKRRSPPVRPARPARARGRGEAIDIVLSEDDVAAIVAAAAKARATAARRAAATGATGFVGIADIVPALPGLPTGHSSIRDQVYAAPPPLPAPGVSEAIRRVRAEEE